ncbi:hypothetical protein T11_2211 [Trichinella zimbabwensis]|uniref:Uncharacterized protein n=1 Tax=Trichinella zimbabwensis TaxID=268475 RepID=A0A0V1HH20_9BILA|nr:hypothetical protein T11_2211 [Trichinella zimbabwensis]
MHSLNPLLCRYTWASIMSICPLNFGNSNTYLTSAGTFSKHCSYRCQSNSNVHNLPSHFTNICSSNLNNISDYIFCSGAPFNLRLTTSNALHFFDVYNAVEAGFYYHMGSGLLLLSQCAHLNDNAENQLFGGHM